MLECVGEGQGVVAFRENTNFLSNSILLVRNINAALVPADPLSITLFVAKDRHLHSIVEQRIWFGVVENVELDTLSFAGIVYAEIEPLGVSLSVNVVLHQQVVLGI